jgi:hypothetical protein
MGRGAKVSMNRSEGVCQGELVCWKSSRLGRFTGSYEPMILVSLVDARSGHAFAQFVSNNSTQEHLRTLMRYIERYGRPGKIETGNASPFVGVGRTGKSPDLEAQKPTNQIQRALHELGIRWSLEDRRKPEKRPLLFLQEARQRLVPCLRESLASTPAEANRYLEHIYLPEWNAGDSVLAAMDTHSALSRHQDLDSILSIVTLREIDSQNLVRYRFRDYKVSSAQNPMELKGQVVRIETHLDGTVHFRLRDQILKVHAVERKKMPRTTPAVKDRRRKRHNRNWMKEFFDRDAPPLWRQMRPQ